MLASRRSSFPCIGQNMPRKSLDMVIEEQSCETPGGDKGLTSLTSLGVPRHRNRSRSLDNTVETNNSFAAFKESLKVGQLKNSQKCGIFGGLLLLQYAASTPSRPVQALRASRQITPARGARKIINNTLFSRMITCPSNLVFEYKFF